MLTRTIQGFGWNRDIPDHRDKYLQTATARVALPPLMDLRTTGFLPPVYDQGDLGSCTANAIAAAVDFERKKQGEPFITPSRLFIYYNERDIEGDPSQDAGAQIRDGIKSVASQGVCPETEWPYSDQSTKFALKPPPACYTDALKFKALTYSRVTQVDYFLKHCIAILGRPVVFGFSVFSSFESDAVAASGIVPMPGSDDAPVGGHAVLAVGYNDATKMFIVRNSWGSGWGQSGYFNLPYAYLLDPSMASDFWVIETES